MWAYVVGAMMAAGGTVFALFNAWATLQDDRRREADERAAGASESHAASKLVA